MRHAEMIKSLRDNLTCRKSDIAYTATAQETRPLCGLCAYQLLTLPVHRERRDAAKTCHATFNGVAKEAKLQPNTALMASHDQDTYLGR